MKIKTKEQYDKRFRRIGEKRRPKQRTHIGHPATFDMLLSPNHAARYVNLNDYYGNIWKPQKYPDHVKMPLMGEFQGCPHSLSYWREDEPDKYGKLVFFAVAMPCVVNHGWVAKVMYGREQLIPAAGKPGEHRDKLGRMW